MLKVSLQRKGTVEGTNLLEQVMWLPRVLLEVVNLFMNVKYVGVNMSQVRRAQDQLGSFEKQLKTTMFKAASRTLEELKAATPAISGDTKDSWSLKVIKQEDILVYKFDSTNPDLVEMLNYGTRPHVILPKNAKALHFFIGSKEIFAKIVHHPGTVGLGFLEKAQKDLADNLGSLRMLKV